MVMLVRDVLDLDIFRQADAEVVAGSEHLGKPVRWVHIAELPDIAYLLQGDELLLTTGMGLRPEANELRRYVRELARVPVACVVVELGRTFTRLPRAMLDEADALGLPLVTLHRETRFVEVTERVHSAIINRQFELLRKAETIGRDFTKLLLQGANLGRIVQTLASIVGNPVVLEDAAHQVVDYAAPGGLKHDALMSWDEHSRSGHSDSEIMKGSVSLENASPRCAWIPVSLRDTIWGRIHILETDTRFDDIDSLALDRAAAAVGLALLADQRATWLSDLAGEGLLADVLRGAFSSDQDVFQRAQALGIDLADKNLVALVVEPKGTASFSGDRPLPEREHQRQRHAALAGVRKAAAHVGAGCLCALWGDRILAVISLPKRRDARTVLDEFGWETSRLLGESLGMSATAGVSATANLRGLAQALQEAAEAARYGARQDALLVHYEDLGLRQLLLRLGDGPELARFVESELKPVLEHDARSGTKLLPTLRIYAETGGNKSQAARHLHIERRTLYHRLARLEKLLGRSIKSPDAHMRLALAVQGLDMLRQDSPDQAGRVMTAPTIAPRFD